MALEIEKKDAKHIVHQLSEFGLPPERGVRYFNVGNESLLETLKEDYIEDYLQDGGATFKLVVGDYGAGKTHFLYCVRDLAWESGFVVSMTQLSPKECPYDDQLAVYRAIARNVIWKSDDPSIPNDYGLDKFLDNHLAVVFDQLKITSPFDGRVIDSRARDWLDGVLRARVESRSFLYAVYAYFEAAIREDTRKKEVLASYLIGEPVTPKQTQSFNVNEKIDKKNAFRMLRSLLQLMRELGYNGTVLLFDEGDRMASMGSSKQQKVACDNLREVIDKCASGTLPGTMFMYAVPHQFIRTVAESYEALAQRIGVRTKVFSAKNPHSPRISLEDLDYGGEEVLQRIGLKLLDLFEAGYGECLDREQQMRNINQLAKSCAGVLSDSHRRTFVKALLETFMEQRREGNRVLEPDDAVERLRNVDEQLNAAASSAAAGEY